MIITFPKLTGLVESVVVGGALPEGLDLPLVRLISQGLNVIECQNLAYVRCPSLIEATSVDISDNPALTEVDLGALGQVTSSITIASNATLEAVDLSSLELSFGPADVVFSLNPLLEAVELPSATVARTLAISNNESIATLDLSALTGAAQINIDANAALSEIVLPELTTVGTAINIQANYSLTEIAMPKLVNGGDITITVNPLLTMIELTLWTPQNSQNFNFAVNALSETCVNAILARAAAVGQGFTLGSIDLSGGTNSAPTGQGILDAEALDVRGVTVHVNET